MSGDPYVGIAAEDPYAGLGAPEAPAQPRRNNWDALRPADARNALQQAQQTLEQSIRRLPPAQQAAARDRFNNDPRIKSIRDKVWQGASAEPYRLGDLMRSKISMGITDRLAPLVDATADSLHGRGGSWTQNYSQHQAVVDRNRAEYQQAHPVADWATLPANLAGAGPAGGAANLTLGGMARTGALVGAVGGVGNARGTMGQQALQIGTSALGGAILGPVIGTVAPYIARGVGAARNTIAGLVGREQAPAATRSGQILLKTLADQGQTPNQAARVVQAAHENGVPMALMDTGDEARGLASAISRKPGPGRKLMREVVIPRQTGQGERIQTSIRRDLGPTANVRAQSEALTSQAQAAAAPHYDQAYAAPGASVFDVSDLMSRPSMRKALPNAVRIAQEEGRDPNALGIRFDEAGNPTSFENPSWQTFDYVKRGLDDVVEAYRDPVTGRLNLDTEGRAVNGTLRDFLARVDKANPDYAAARQAYAGPARMASALRKGASIGNSDAEDIWAHTRDMTPPELAQYRLGVRSALGKLVNGRTDGSDKVNALLNTPKKRAALAQVFGGEEGLDRFLTTLGQEGELAKTYGRVDTGSKTAHNLADDANLDGMGGIAANAAGRAVKGHGLVSNAISTLADLHKYGTGKAGERVVSELAAGLSETDPAAFREAIKAARRAAALNRVGKRPNVPAKRLGSLTGGKVANGVVSLMEPNQ